ncbi:tail fiber assembly protein [Pseudomonas viridiflava]|uniref:tail fiber assembly protein n=1 Tax=Pseudomonas viridiflava TaxID=33069 RepID=UPI000F06B5F8|nr:tail fiber assembly protein [Pseudomonas viridiflava]
MNYYSYETCGFYCTDIVSCYPEDAVEISDDEFRRLLEGVRNGKVIVPGNAGNPILMDAIDASGGTCEETSAQKLLRLKSIASERRAALAIRIEEVEDAVSLGMALNSELEELNSCSLALVEWRRYSVFLARIDGSDGASDEVDWPPVPIA